MQQEKTLHSSVVKFKNFFEPNWCPSLERSPTLVKSIGENRIKSLKRKTDFGRYSQLTFEHYCKVTSQWNYEELIEKACKWIKTCVVLKIYKNLSFENVAWMLTMSLPTNISYFNLS